jgi:hypothetical protein
MVAGMCGMLLDDDPYELECSSSILVIPQIVGPSFSLGSDGQSASSAQSQ